MADYSYQRYPQNNGENSYQPTYPPPPQAHGAQAPPMNRSGEVPLGYGSGYESGRGGSAMRGGPMRGRGDSIGRGAQSRGGMGGGRGGGGYPPPGSLGYNRGYPEVPKNQYHERDEWGPGGEGPAVPSQPIPQRPPQPRGSTILILGIPAHVTEEDLLNHFGSAGMIKMSPKTRVPEIWLGPRPGEARITFQDPQVAVNAVQWYNNGDFQGSVIRVEMDREAVNPPPPMPPLPPPMVPMSERGRPGGPPHPRGDRFPPQRGGGGYGGGGYGGGGYGGGGGGGTRGGRVDMGRSFEKRDGDWICSNPDCQNTNFKWRMECNRCRAPRPDDGGDFQPSMGRSNDRFDSRPPGFSSGGRGGFRGGRGFSPRGMGGHPGPMGRGGYGGGRGGSGGGGPMRDGRGGRGGYPSRGAPNGNWRPRPY